MLHGVEDAPVDASVIATPETVLSAFLATSARVPRRRYVRSSGVDLTYGEALALASALAGRLGRRVSDEPVAFCLPNGAAFLVAYWGVLLAGGHPALLNPALPDKSRETLLAAIDTPLLLAPSEEMRTGHAETLVLRDETLRETLGAPAGPVRTPHSDADDTAVYLFSGGTTGLPKRVRHRQAGLMAAVHAMEWGWPTRDGEVWLPVAPFTHVYGFLMGVTNPVLKGASLIIPDRFQPDHVADLLAEHGVTLFGGGPPAIYQGLMAASDFENRSFPNLRICPGGGAPFPVEVLRRWKALTGLTICEGYGMTEIAPIAVNTASDGMRDGAAGRPPPGTRIEIVDAETGARTLPVGEPGEIRVRGPHVMTGYVDDADESAHALRDGWVYTGDIGVLDEDGFLTITDRKKNVIFFKGFNVFPREVEEALVRHDDVDAACVVGVPDERAGERVVAFVSPRGGRMVDETALMAHCADRLVAYKLPSELRVLNDLPLTAAGKLDRTALTALAAGA